MPTYLTCSCTFIYLIFLPISVKYLKRKTSKFLSKPKSLKKSLFCSGKPQDQWETNHQGLHWKFLQRYLSSIPNGIRDNLETKEEEFYQNQSTGILRSLFGSASDIDNPLEDVKKVIYSKPGVGVRVEEYSSFYAGDTGVDKKTSKTNLGSGFRLRNSAETFGIHEEDVTNAILQTDQERNRRLKSIIQKLKMHRLQQK